MELAIWSVASLLVIDIVMTIYVYKKAINDGYIISSDDSHDISIRMSKFAESICRFIKENSNNEVIIEYHQNYDVRILFWYPDIHKNKFEGFHITFTRHQLDELQYLKDAILQMIDVSNKKRLSRTEHKAS